MFISTYISFLSFCLDLKTEAILLKWGVPHYGWYLNFILWTCGDLNLVKGLDAKRGGGIGSWGYTSALSCNIDTFRVASIGSSDNTGLTPDSDRKGREASSIDFFFFFKAHQSLRSEWLQLHQDLATLSIPRCRIPSFPISVPCETETSTYVVIQPVRLPLFYVPFSAICLMAIGNKYVLQVIHRNFKVIYAAFDLGIWIQTSSFFPPTFSSKLRSNQLISLYLLVFQKQLLKFHVHRHLVPCFSYSSWLGISVIFYISILPDHIMDYQCFLYYRQ